MCGPTDDWLMNSADGITRDRKERMKIEKDWRRRERVMGGGRRQEDRMEKQRRGVPDKWWRLVFSHGKRVAKCGPVASVLFVCVTLIWLHPS